MRIITLVLFMIIGGVSSADALEQKMQVRETAVFAGGCFWCMEHPFERLDGVESVTSGYTGGHVKNPDYHQVSAGKTGHAEAVQVVFDPKKVSYQTLLEIFWRNIDPTVKNRQFCDVGSQYRSAIFYATPKQKAVAVASLAALKKSKPFAGDIQTEIVPAGKFYAAEGYHQDYYKKNPIRYHFYRFNCGRDQRLEQLWGDEAGGEYLGKGVDHE